MFEFITMFFPSVLSTTIVLSALYKNRYLQEGASSEARLHTVKLFAFYVLFNNITSLLLYSIFIDVDSTVINGHLNPAFLSLKFVTLALLMALIWGYMGRMLMFNVRLFFSWEIIMDRLNHSNKSKREGEIIE